MDSKKFYTNGIKEKGEILIMKKEVSTTLAPGAIGPYSQAIIVGDMVYSSGQLGMDPITGVLADNIEDQTKQALHNLQEVLEAAGASMSNVVKTTIFLKDMDDFVAVNEIYETFFCIPFPARSAVQIAKLPKDGLVEIEAIARVAER